MDEPILTPAQQATHEQQLAERAVFIKQWRLEAAAGIAHLEKHIRAAASGRPARGMILMDGRPEYRIFRQSIRACSKHRAELKKLLRTVK